MIDPHVIARLKPLVDYVGSASFVTFLQLGGENSSSGPPLLAAECRACHLLDCLIPCLLACLLACLVACLPASCVPAFYWIWTAAVPVLAEEGQMGARWNWRMSAMLGMCGIHVLAPGRLIRRTYGNCNCCAMQDTRAQHSGLEVFVDGERFMSGGQNNGQCCILPFLVVWSCPRPVYH